MTVGPPPQSAVRPLTCLALVLLFAVALAGCSGGNDEPPRSASATSTTPISAPRPTTLAHDARLVRRELAGVPQTGLVLGSARAPVTILEYVDLTCARCISAHRTLVPALVERYVQRGVATLELRPLARDTRSRSLARSVYAASEQRRGWELVRLAALRARSATGTTRREPDTRLAAALDIDLSRWRQDRLRPRWARELLADANVAAIGRFEALPVFLVRERNAAHEAFVVVTQPTSLGDLAAAIEQARR